MAKVNLGDLTERTFNTPRKVERKPLPSRQSVLASNVNEQVWDTFRKFHILDKTTKTRLPMYGATAEQMAQYNEKRKNESALLAQELYTIPSTIDSLKENNAYLDEFLTWLHTAKEHRSKKRLKNFKPRRSDEQVWRALQRAFSERLAVHQNSDLDAQAAMLLLKVTQFSSKDSDVYELQHDDAQKGYTHIDTGGENGIHIEGYKEKTKIKGGATLMNSTAFIDHHKSQKINGSVYHGASSSTQIILSLLKGIHAIPQKHIGQIERFVKFVNIVDSAGYEIAGRDYTYLDKTLFGLHRLLVKDPRNIHFIYDHFADPRNTGFEVLDPAYLQKTYAYGDPKKYKTEPNKDGKISLSAFSKCRKETNEKALIYGESLLDEDYFVSSPINGESFICDLDGKLHNPAEVASNLAMGVLKVLPNNKIYIYSPKSLDLDTFGRFGKIVRGHFLIVDIQSIQRYNDFIKTLFGANGDEKIFIELREKISSIKHKIEVQNQGAVIKNISTQMINAFLDTHKPLTVEDISVGKTYPGIVNNVLPYGVFITLPGAHSVLIHKNDLPIGSLDTYKSGQEVSLTITKVEQKGDSKIHISAVPTKEKVVLHKIQTA